MEQILCKICGQPLAEIREGFYKCSGCLSEFKKETNITVEQKRIQEAYELIRKGNFSDAEDICSALLSSNETLYEAYWVRSLAKNGVIFVWDIGDRMVPTCQNIVEEQFISDADVQKAISLAPIEIAENYRSQGERIEAIRREWFDMASKEAPYDVFICFKDSDKENGISRTRDSEYAQDLYNYLCTKGFNVFFSRVSLMGKVSEHYEPYIYNALKTSKVMIVYGEKAEYFNSTWLKNEWSRFIARMQRENMPKDSLIVAYRGVDPYRIPSALLGGRQGLDLAKPSAFNILVEKVVDAVAKANKVITLERKEIKGGQMSKKASAIMQAEIKKRTIGAHTPVKIDFSLESKLQMVHNYLGQGMWQEAEETLAVILEQVPQNGDALICKLLLKTGNKTLDDLARSNHFNDVELLQGVLDSADQETAQKLLDIFYGLKTLPMSEYRAVLEAVIPYEYENRDFNIQTAFDDALRATNTEIFDLLLKTLDSSEVDRYISLNKMMLIKLLDSNMYQAAKVYISNILSVNEGNLDILRVDCEISLVTNDENFAEKFENLLKYAKSTNKYVRFFIDKILEDKRVTASESEMLKKLITYYNGELIELKETLLLIISLLIREKLFEDAEYFDNLILSEDSHCADAWLYLCFIGTQSASVVSMVDSDIPMNKCRGFDEYCSLVDGEKQREIFSALKKQKERIEEKNQKKYSAAVSLQNKDRISELEQAVNIYASIATFKDSAKRVTICEKRIKEIQDSNEKKRIAKEKAKKKAKKIAKIILVSAIIVVLLVAIMVYFVIPLLRFNQADTLLNEGKYEEAMLIYQDLDGFSDSESRTILLNGISKINNSEFDEGIKEILRSGVPVQLTYGMYGGDFSDVSYLSITSSMFYELDAAISFLSTSSAASPAALAAKGSVPEVIEYTYNSLSDFVGIQTPGRNGYRFVGWELDAYSYQLEETFAIKLNAKWSTKDYDVQYDLDGGIIEGTNISEYNPEDSAFTLSNPTREGYTFAGWVGTDLSEATIDVTVPTGSYGDRSYTATWRANEYTIYYDAMGGTIPSDTQKVSYDSNVVYLIPEKAGYQFVGWYEGTVKCENGKWERTSDLSLVAKWEIVGYKIQYELDGGVNHTDNPSSYRVDSDTITLNDPTRNGFNFVGWTYEGQSTPIKIVTIPKGSTGDKKFEAHWEALGLMITLNANGGTTPIKTIGVTYGENFVIPDAEWIGHTFSGWYLDGRKITSGVCAFTSNVTLVAKWDTVEYSITYNLNGGINSPLNPSSYISELELSLEAPVRTGYEFIGWTYSGQSTPVKTVVIPKDSTGNRTFTANWKAIESTIALDANGGTVTPSQITVIYDSDFSLPTPTREGYTFSGWYIGDTKVLSGKCTFTSDVALIAKWSTVGYSISYELNGGVNNSQNPSEYSVDQKITLLEPTRTGYIFIGWTYKNQTTPIKDVVIPAGTTSNLSFVANWQPIQAVITLNANGGKVTPTSMNATFDTFLNLPTPERTGYRFDGWFVGTKQYTSGVWTTDDNITLVAKWIANSYEATYDANGGSVSSSSKNYTYDTSYTLLEPERTGYEFLGWYNGDDLVEQSDTWKFDTNISLKAEWKAITYTVSLNANGGTGVDDTYTVTYDSDYTLPIPEKTGYTFNGWYNGSKQITGGIWKNISDMGVTAHWTANTYTITYKDNMFWADVVFDYNYDGSTVQRIRLYNGQTLEYPDIPMRSGYIFTGWYADSECKNPFKWDDKDINQNLHLYAGWIYISDSYRTPEYLEASQISSYYMLRIPAGKSNYWYFVAKESGSHTIYLTRDFINWGPDAILTNLTKNQEIRSLSIWTNEPYKVTFTCSAGDVIGLKIIQDNSFSDPVFIKFIDFYNNTLEKQITTTSYIENNDVEVDIVYGDNYELYSPTRAGYIFDGWYYGNTLVQSGKWNIPENVTLTAKWIKK